MALTHKTHRIGRPPVTKERQTEVLQAYARSVAKYGLDGATLEVVAAEAGLSRPLIRHHLGNKNKMLEKLAQYIVDIFDEKSKELINTLPKTRRVNTIIEYLFADSHEADHILVLVFTTLVTHSTKDAALGTLLKASVLDFETRIATEIRAEYPCATPQNVAAVAHGIVAIFFNLTSLKPLDLPHTNTINARAAVTALMQCLHNSKIDTITT